MLNVRRYYGKHQGGTKDYKMLVVSRDDDPNTHWFIKRWGRTGAVGQCQISRHDLRSHAENKLEREKANRKKRGYETVDDMSFEADWDTFQRQNHAMMARIKSQSRECFDHLSEQSAVIAQSGADQELAEAEEVERQVTLDQQRAEMDEWGAFS